MESHFLVCPECLRFFDPATGETPEKYKNIKAPSSDKDLCKPCRTKLEDERQWSTTTKTER